MSNKLPPALVRKLGSDPFFDLNAFEEAHQTGQAVTSVRVNPHKWPLRSEVPISTGSQTLGGIPVAPEARIPWCDTGYYLPERPVFTLDPLFHAGCYYVQEASSMFLAHVVRSLGLDRAPSTALDLCAAPGGKSTLLQAYLHPDSLLVSNELIKSRVGILADNLTRWGAPNTVTTNNDPSAFGRLRGFFDLLLVDAPCSGSGMFRKDSQALDEWSEAAVKLCKERQQRILSDSIACLDEEGILIYSTCSFSEEENEQIADWLVDTFGMESIPVPVDPAWGITATHSPLHSCQGYRFYPHRLQGEGFYLAVFKAKGSPHPPEGRNRDEQKIQAGRKKAKPEKNALDPGILEPWISHPNAFFNFMVGEDLHIIPEHLREKLSLLQQGLYLKNAGTRLGKPHKNTLIPDHALALSSSCHPSLPKLEMDRETALHYLRKQALPPGLGAGFGSSDWVLASYASVPLGWAKVLPGRINNYYPKDWRIVHL